MNTGISGTVGYKGNNLDVDVETIQKLLNRVPGPVGPPTPFLAEDGDCGVLTINAISRFQQLALGFQDGLVEPDRNTHAKLVELAGAAADILIRTDLAEALVPLVQPIVLEAIAALEVVFKNPTAPGPENDRTREALMVHFLLDDGREDHIGMVFNIFQGIRVGFDDRSIFWSGVTMKQAKIELNERIGSRVPAIYVRERVTERGAIVFTPNYKPLDLRDGLGYGPQMLGYRLIAGVARHVLNRPLNVQLVESDSPGFPGADFPSAHQNPAAYGSFAFHIKLGVAQPFGDKFRNI